MGGDLTAQTTAKALVTEKDKVSYAIGMDVGKSFQPVAEYIDLGAFERAVKNAFDGGKPLQSEEEAKATDQALRMSMAAKQGAPVPGMPPGALPPAVAKDKVGLMLGDRAVGPSLAPLKDEIDFAVLMQALRTSFAKGQPLLSEQEAMATMQAFMTRKQSMAGQKNREEGAAFLTRNKAVKGVITTQSGLQYMVLRAGNGARPTPSSRVRVNYEGKLLDGKIFDSSYARGEAAEFGLGQVIAGWTEGVSLMPVGSKYRFWIPSGMAYGPAGSQNGPVTIGPDSTLVFDVELMGILQ
ncbi:MAG TPA: FKBP-type peptidyl-prolyl cis-trans isomerase [Pseudoxanthomonas sp.]|nr:FKBP-type peptidyl-prolyl cis-trans isomerase [Pseudoxanthomonas sp.]